MINFKCILISVSFFILVLAIWFLLLDSPKLVHNMLVTYISSEIVDIEFLAKPVYYFYSAVYCLFNFAISLIMYENLTTIINRDKL